MPGRAAPLAPTPSHHTARYIPLHPALHRAASRCTHRDHLLCILRSTIVPAVGHIVRFLKIMNSRRTQPTLAISAFEGSARKRIVASRPSTTRFQRGDSNDSNLEMSRHRAIPPRRLSTRKRYPRLKCKNLIGRAHARHHSFPPNYLRFCNF